MEGTVSLTLLGRKKFLKKDKSGYCYMLSAMRPFDEEEIASGNLGYAITENFIPQEAWEQIQQSDINREFVYDYGMGKYGKPEITGIIFAQDKKENK